MALAVLGLTVSGQAVSIELQGGAFKVVGWKAPASAPKSGWSSVFAIYAGTGDIPPLLGTYDVEAGALVFHPRFPLAAGVHYRAVFRASPASAPVEKSFDRPVAETRPAARVEAVYPSADVLPSNQLRLYIYFSAPMSRREAGRRVQLLDANGKVLPEIFLPGEELWDPQYKRLTMTFDPGRIKRGLTSNEALGPPIVEGKRYTLVIDKGWPDANGVPMVEGFRKAFRGGPAERNPPDPKQWRVVAPKAGSAEAVVLDFPTPMNYPLLLRMVQVSDGRAAIAGKVSVAKRESEWRFTPDQPWKPGNYKLTVDTGIEDLAGNHVGQAFDIDVFERVTEHISSKTIPLPFTIR